MKLTKFQHACFVIEKDGASIVVDPGAFTHDFIMPKHVAAVFVTHNHPDHLNNQLIVTILREHPKAVLLAHESIVHDFQAEHTQAVTVGETVSVGDITLQFVGGVHEQIYPTLPVPVNIGVIIENQLYYPGDSFYLPQQPIEALALPVSAPWLKLSESIDFVKALKPIFIFPTHDAILSEEGKAMVDRMITGFTDSIGAQYKRIDDETIEL